MNDQVSAQMAAAVDTPVVEEPKKEERKGKENVEFVQTPAVVGDESTPR